MGNINWNNGQLLSLKEGETASCTGALNSGQLYCLFFYNSASNQAATNMSVVWSQSHPPVTVTVPGTTRKEGLAALCFVDGSQTNSVSATVLHGNQGAKIQAFIGSVKMPSNTKGITNKQIPLNGEMFSFKKFTRYYNVPASHWYSGMIQSDVNQFTSVMFTEQEATVYIVNELTDPSRHISYCGDSRRMVSVKRTPEQSIPFSFQGNGSQIVWLNADSIQNSQDAYICVSSLARAYSALAKTYELEEA